MLIIDNTNVFLIHGPIMSQYLKVNDIRANDILTNLFRCGNLLCQNIYAYPGEK